MIAPEQIIIYEDHGIIKCLIPDDGIQYIETGLLEDSSIRQCLMTDIETDFVYLLPNIQIWSNISDNEIDTIQ